MFNRIQPSSAYYVPSQFFSGVSYVQLRKSIPAVRSFQKAITALEEGVERTEVLLRMGEESVQGGAGFAVHRTMHRLAARSRRVAPAFWAEIYDLTDDFDEPADLERWRLAYVTTSPAPH